MIYLDHQAGTPLLPEAREAMERWWTEEFASPSSLHSGGVAARKALDQAREQFAALLHAESAESILFTGNGTEAVNLAIKGAFFASAKRGRTHVVFSEGDHPAVLSSAKFLESLGATTTRVKLDQIGRVDPAEVRDSIREETFLVCAHHSNHDVGTVQRVEEMGEAAAEQGVLFFVDAVASGGWLEMDVQRWNASLVAISPHRFYGPKGAGVLYRNRRARIQPLIHGGEQEDGLRAGTQNVPAIVGGGVAAEVAGRELTARSEHARGLAKQCWEEISRRIPAVHLNGPLPGPDRHPGQLNLSFEGLEGEGLALALDMRGVRLASGAACVTKNMRVPPTLAAMGVSEDVAKGTILLSFGKDNRAEEVGEFVGILEKVCVNLREMSPTWS